MRLTLRLVASPQGTDPGLAVLGFDERGGLLGRAPTNSHVIADPSNRISSQHASIELERDRFVLTDLSRNGVIFNDDPKALGRGNRRPIADGDRVEFGPLVYVADISGTPRDERADRRQRDPLAGFGAAPVDSRQGLEGLFGAPQSAGPRMLDPLAGLQPLAVGRDPMQPTGPAHAGWPADRFEASHDVRLATPVPAATNFSLARDPLFGANPSVPPVIAGAIDDIDDFLSGISGANASQPPLAPMRSSQPMALAADPRLIQLSVPGSATRPPAAALIPDDLDLLSASPAPAAVASPTPAMLPPVPAAPGQPGPDDGFGAFSGRESALPMPRAQPVASEPWDAAPDRHGLGEARRRDVTDLPLPGGFAPSSPAVMREPMAAVFDRDVYAGASGLNPPMDSSTPLPGVAAMRATGPDDLTRALPRRPMPDAAAAPFEAAYPLSMPANPGLAAGDPQRQPLPPELRALVVDVDRLVPVATNSLAHDPVEQMRRRAQERMKPQQRPASAISPVDLNRPAPLGLGRSPFVAATPAPDMAGREPRRVTDGTVGDAASADRAKLNALWSALGIDPATVDPAQETLALEELGRFARVAAQGMVQILAMRRSVKDELRIDQTMIRPNDNNPFKLAATGDEAIAEVLLRRTGGYMALPVAAQQGLDNLREHNVVQMVALQSAITVVLGRFNPALIEKTTKKRGLIFRKPDHRQLWTRFVTFFRDFEKNMDRHTRSVLEEAFAEAQERVGGGKK